MKDSRSSQSDPETESERLGPRPSMLPQLPDSDFISALPDPILQHILSFMTVKDFIKTSVLSKRWRYVWAEVPVLSFFDGSVESISRFERFVTQTLASYRGKKVRKINVAIQYEEWPTSSSLVDECIRFSTEHKVDFLNLFMLSKSQTRLQPQSRYQLSQSVYSNSSLLRLDTQQCNFKPIVSVSWTSLKVLCIRIAKLSNDALASILLGSPNLECLAMYMVQGVDKIIVTSSNLKLNRLILVNSVGRRGPISTSTMELSAPHLRSLSLVASNRIKFINLLSLLELSLEITEAAYETWIGLVRKLPALQKLRLSYKSFQFDDKNQYWESWKTHVDFNHLETVLISGFEQCWCVGSRLQDFTSMVEFLLKNAMVLRQMVIFVRSSGTISTNK